MTLFCLLSQFHYLYDLNPFLWRLRLLFFFSRKKERMYCCCETVIKLPDYTVCLTRSLSHLCCSSVVLKNCEWASWTRTLQIIFLCVLRLCRMPPFLLSSFKYSTFFFSKVKHSRNKSWRMRGGMACTFTLTFGTTRTAELSALRSGRPLPTRNFVDTHFCKRLSGPQC